MLFEVKWQAEPLPLAQKAEHFQMGQAPTPDRCVKFIQDVICLNATKGYVIPGKYLCFRIAIKNMTGSDKIRKILLRLGPPFKKPFMEPDPRILASHSSSGNPESSKT